MKNKVGIFILIIAFLGVFSIFTVSAEIRIDAKQKVLIAPQSVQYQWYYNGKLLTGKNLEELTIQKSGLYEVETISAEGFHSRSKIMVQVVADKIVRIFIAGDSTAATYNPDRYPLTGWGQVFQNVMVSDSVKQIEYIMQADSVVVYNHARGGRSTRTFWEEGLWDELRNQLKTGDFVLIQFGHNDAAVDYPDRYVDTAGYKMYLRKFVNEARAKGAVPVLCTPVNRNYPWSGKSLTNVHGNYPLAMKQVAEELHVPLIDVTQRSLDHFSEMGKDYVTNNYFMNLPAGVYDAYPDGDNDNTHFQPEGATVVAQMVYEGLKELRNVNIINPDSAGYVEGSNWYEVRYTSEVILAAYPKLGFVFKSWGGDLSSTDNPLILNLDSSINIEAVFEATTEPQYKVITTVEGFGEVRVSPIGNIYIEDTEITLNAIPETNRKFYSWVGSVIDTSAQISLSITEEMDVNAIFVEENGTVFPVEDAFYVDNKIQSGKEKASGTAYTVLGDVDQDSIVWEVYPSDLAKFGLKLRYKNENSSAVLADIYINDELEVEDYSFDTTGSGEWDFSKRKIISLNDDISKIKIVIKEQGNQINIDCLLLVGGDFFNSPQTGILNHTSFKNLVIVPNPVKPGIPFMVKGDFSDWDLYFVEISNLNGQQIYSKEYVRSLSNKKIYVNIQGLNSGIFILRIHNKENAITRKLIVE